MQNQYPDTIAITAPAAQLFVALLDAHDHSIIKGRDARKISNEIEMQLQQLQQLQVQKSEEAPKTSKPVK